MKNKLNYEKFYNQLDSDTQKQIDSITKDSDRQDSLVIERVGIENKEINLDSDKPECIGYISRATTDHSNDFMVPTGINTKIFDLNPVVFFNHNSHGLPVGKCVNIEVTEDGVKTKTEFATDVEFSNDVYKLVKGGFLNTFSIGFLALDYTLRGESTFDNLNSELISKYPMYDGSADRIITKWLLLEYSVVGIPDNWNAVVTDKSISLTDTTIKIINPTMDRTISKVIDRNVKVLDIKQEQNTVKSLTESQKTKIETFYLETKKGRVLRYGIDDILSNLV